MKMPSSYAFWGDFRRKKVSTEYFLREKFTALSERILWISFSVFPCSGLWSGGGNTGANPEKTVDRRWYSG